MREREEENMKKHNVKSEKGFTMTDLIVALMLFAIFTGVIGTLMYSSYKINLQTKMAGTATNYAIQILEDIDKIAYEEVTNGKEKEYRSKFKIPSGFGLKLEVEGYNNETGGDDLIKKVKLTITYQLAEKSEQVVINKLKIKEL